MSVMRTMAPLLVTGCALALAVGSPARSTPAPGIQVADMDMGPDSPELGNSTGDMVLTDPGHDPADADMVTGDPGHVPHEAGMVVDDPGSLPPPPDMVVTDPGSVPQDAQMDLGSSPDVDQQDDIGQ